MDSQIRLIGLLALTFLLGVVTTGAGYWVVNSIGKRHYSTDSASLKLTVKSGSKIPEQSARLSGSGSFDTPVSSVSKFEDLEQFDSAFQRGVALHNFLANLGEERVSDLLAQSQRIYSSSERDELQLAGVRRLAQLNPKLALSRVLEMNQSGALDLVGAVFREWAYSDLDGAVSKAQTLDGRTKDHALATIVQVRSDLSEDALRAIARDFGNEQIALTAIAQRKLSEAIGDPEKAWNDLAVDMQHEAENTWAITRVAIAWVKQSGLSVLEQISQTLTDSNIQLSVVRDVLMDVAGSNPAGAFRFALSVENDPWNSTVRNVARIWANTDPRSALVAASEIEKLSVRKDAEESVLAVWATNNHQEVLEIVGNLPVHLQSTATMNAVREFAKHNPEEAARFVVEMESGLERSQTASFVASIWAQRDHMSALEWILNEPGIEEVRSTMLRSVVMRLVQVDPQLAVDTALAQPIEEVESDVVMNAYRGTGMELSVISSLVYSDLDKAIELLPQVREGHTRTVANRTVAAALVNEGEIDRAFSLAQQMSDGDSESFHLAIATAWAGRDPVGLLDSMDRLPGEEVKSRAAMMLISRNSFSTELSDEQVEKAKNFLTEEDAKALAASGSE